MFRDPASSACAEPALPRPSLSPARIGVRILLVYGCLEAALWTERPLRDVWSLLAAVLIALFLATDLARGRRLADLGIGLRGLRDSWWIPLAAALLSSAILVAGWQWGTLHHLFGPAAYYAHASGYAFWTVVQEFIAQAFFYLNLEEALGSKRAIFANGLLFSIAHWPNPVLVPVTLLGGWVLTTLFARYRNIYPLALAHALVALSIAVAVPDAVHRHMRVGIGYQHYRSAPVHHRSTPPPRRAGG